MYANEITRLAGLAGLEENRIEHVFRLTFIKGLPHSIRVPRQQLLGVKSMPISELIERNRVLTSKLSNQKLHILTKTVVNSRLKIKK